MIDRTPYDADRAAYSRVALARLVLSQRAAALSGRAAALVPTRHDRFNGPGARASEAGSLAAITAAVLTSAVVYERERGTSWELIGHYLDITGEAASERFTPAVEEWHEAFEVPYRLDETGRKRITRLPSAAYDPASYVRHLDLWAHQRTALSDDHHPVSGGLDNDGDDDDADMADDRIHGRIRAAGLPDLLRILAGYLRAEPPATDQRSCTLAGISETVEVDVTADGDAVDVTVSGARAADLRIRISTLLDVFEARAATEPG
ncbi:hypothetical protein AB0G04_05715 [Actinoplanes sp. NPDC023801]|uniref:hypothetical protein n=1 Tax=Actinoplanes sp. NPDC023801 TaxID=3154595 RepID=UPI0034010565